MKFLLFLYCVLSSSVCESAEYSRSYVWYKSSDLFKKQQIDLEYKNDYSVDLSKKIKKRLKKHEVTIRQSGDIVFVIFDNDYLFKANEARVINHRVISKLASSIYMFSDLQIDIFTSKSLGKDSSRYHQDISAYRAANVLDLLKRRKVNIEILRSYALIPYRFLKPFYRNKTIISLRVVTPYDDYYLPIELFYKYYR